MLLIYLFQNIFVPGSKNGGNGGKSVRTKKKRSKTKKKECEQRRRDKIKTDPVAYEAAKAKERERWQKRRAEKKVKTIKDMTPREQRTQRAIWRKEYRDKQQFKKRQEKAMRIATENSPQLPMMNVFK
ncbi:unnamed protein product [Arctia plantaginis]|uniref:Uncharacterized protein n=1 Tax=Arctia plantaginis TaxID=874455 RepID=A0A8S0YV47_ARCPL|nr:unnamed protein product [Arctia plantaginis]